ncbi:hypothetical protein, conserved [Eimeria tenella]|uniref:Macro domain-containing protein n=1 Tax=Eimeria tenella TaxID=5802 RepID=U6KZ20_EIMTE|nr:hypothetical protein, conserved [Eimeria tenella]CDJ40750.1 hypothetical protein, conserved [Eimeria tenella]|eukprot:XP_013231500.1 hypothetical protein, conserved [Eimeria tenella]
MGSPHVGCRGGPPGAPVGGPPVPLRVASRGGLLEEHRWGHLRGPSQLLLLPAEQQQQQLLLLLLLSQQRHFRHIPTSGFPGFLEKRKLKKKKKEEPSSELQRLLLRRVEAFSKPVIAPSDPPLEMDSSRIPSALQVSSPLLPPHLLLPFQQQQQQQQQQQREEQPQELPAATSLWDSVALHLGDLSKLKSCGAVVGIDRSLRIYGEGRGFRGSAALFSAAGPWLEAFLQQQQQQQHVPLQQEQQQDAAAAAAAVDSFLATARQLHASLLPPKLQQQWPLSASAAADTAAAAAAAAATGAAAAARNAAAALNSASSDPVAAAAAAAAAAAEREPLPPQQLLRPGALVVTPGFGAPHLFLLHCVEPNAVLTQQQLLQQLLQLIDCDVAEARHQRKELQLQQQQQQQEFEQRRKERAPRLYLLECCYRRALAAAAALQLQTVTLPLLGTGAGGYPLHAAAYCAAAAAHRWLQQQQQQQQRLKIVFCTPERNEWKALDVNIRRRMQLFTPS